MTTQFFMMRNFGLLSVLSTSGMAATATLPPLNEKADIERRLDEFYNNPNNTDIMSEKVPKFSAKDGRHVSPNQGLRLRGPQPTSPILKAAQGKATPLYHKVACNSWQHHFSRSPCAKVGTSSVEVEDHDQVEGLTDSFISSKKVVHDLNRIPVIGRVATLPWTDDYWRIRWAGISYRYSSGVQFKNYKDALASYSQPKEFKALTNLSDADAEKKIATWSPAEKYDILVGDTDFSLTEEQRGEAENNVDETGDVPDWMGICDGWSAAGLITPTPKKMVEAVGVNDLRVKWYPSDIRAITSLAWARGNYNSNFIGGRCDVKTPQTYPNGRIKNPDCFDTNPATFHLALGNMIGIAKKGFVMDASFDAEVWNQPVVGYRLQYFNPMNHKNRSQKWSDVAVNYDDEFKAVDRFQKPMTRGTRNGKNFDDSNVEKIVGVIVTIDYMNEAVANSGEDAPDDTTTRATYIYDLELTKEKGKYIATGGEWHNNEHPDFLWTPTADAIATDGDDKFKAKIDLTEAPSPDLARYASKPSGNGSPLCGVISKLVETSSGKKYPKCEHQ